LEFKYTNNIVEYEAILHGLIKLKAINVKRALLMSDSQEITGHVDKISRCRNPTLELYLDTI
jgi:ribonuclease HI